MNGEPPLAKARPPVVKALPPVAKLDVPQLEADRPPVLAVLVPRAWYIKTGRPRLGDGGRSVSAIYLDQPFGRQRARRAQADAARLDERHHRPRGRLEQLAEDAEANVAESSWHETSR